jgi:hypothetical protein
MNLTEEQVKAVEQGYPISLVVDRTECVLLRKDLYDQLRELLEDWDPRIMRRHMAEMMRDDWTDPAMNVYNK